MYRNVLRMYRSRTAKNTCTEMDVVCTEVVMYRKCPPLCTETVMYRKRRNPLRNAAVKTHVKHHREDNCMVEERS